MCEVAKQLNVAWQLVSQFVSWDFCRYMCEQSENQASETDALTFLRSKLAFRIQFMCVYIQLCNKISAVFFRLLLTEGNKIISAFYTKHSAS